MYSIGRMISNFRDFYNDINAATLTGAIDVVVVEQPDGEFTCSPFHVRFGKLGVLRSKEKLVDIEINGEIRDIHMKLGESGEAFFVEGVYEEDEAVPENLATSPITVSDFPPTYGEEDTKLRCPRPRRNSADVASEFLDDNPLNQPSDYSQRRYTDGGESEMRRERQMLQDKQQQQFLQDRLKQEQQLQAEQQQQQLGDEVFAMEEVESGSGVREPPATPVLPKTFRAETVGDDALDNGESAARKLLPSVSDFRPIDGTSGNGEANAGESPSLVVVAPPKASDQPDETATEDNGKTASSSGGGGGSGKKKRRRRSLLKKKNSQRKNSNSSSACSVQSEQELETQSDSMFFREAKLAAENSVMSQSMGAESCDTPSRLRDPDIHFFSDTEVSSAQSMPHSGGPAHYLYRSPRGSRPCTPVQSDTEFEMSQRQFQADEDNANASGAESAQPQSWRWGELPSPPPKSAGQQQSPADEGSTPDEEKKKIDEAKQAERNSMLSGMFSFMKQNKRLRQKKAPVEGLYLADLSAEDMDPEVAALYFPRTQVNKKRNEEGVEEEEDYESGNGPSLTQSPSSLDGGACGGSKSLDSDFDDAKHHEKNNDEILISLCGGLEGNGPSNEQFQRHIVPYSEVCRDPYVLENPNVVVRLGGKYYNWKTACPIVMTLLVYQQPLPQSAIERLCSDQIRLNNDIEPNKVPSSNESPKDVGKSYWWYWRRSSDKTQTAKSLSKDDSVENKTVITIEAGTEIVQEAVESNQVACSVSIDIPGARDSTVATQTPAFADSEVPAATGSDHKEDGYSGSQSSEESDPETARSSQQPASRPLPEKYRKTLRLSSEQIQSLNLKEGINEVVFSVTTAYQGTSRCKCYMYRWKYDDKVVISDIDGTITKSDVLGHILPIVGKDWAQSGVAQLFTKIKNNGYKLLYLSSRAIGQAKGTRDYLKSIKQNDLSLPDGPLLLNPTSLISAFHREVIEKKPEQFKISCLNDIQALFPADIKPFYAGYGNRINDVWAYRAVGIPTMRIFTINHRGELKHELTQTFQSSYSNMSFIVDQLFPPLLEDASEFSHFIYWRDPLPEVPPFTGENGAPSSSKGSSRGQSPLPTIPENSISH